MIKDQVIHTERALIKLLNSPDDLILFDDVGKLVTPEIHMCLIQWPVYFIRKEQIGPLFISHERLLKIITRNAV